MGLAVKGGGAMPVFGVDPFCAAEMAGDRKLQNKFLIILNICHFI